MYIVTHFKTNNLYLVITENSKHTENKEFFVVYYSFKDKIFYSKPKDLFFLPVLNKDEKEIIRYEKLNLFQIIKYLIKKIKFFKN